MIPAAVFDVLSADVDHTHEPPLTSESKSEDKDKSSLISKSKSVSKSDSKSQSTSKSKSKGEDKENQPVLSTRSEFAFKASSLVQTPGRRHGRRRDMAITTLAGCLTGLKHVVAVTRIPFVPPIASLLLVIINIRDETTQYQDYSAVLAEKLQTIITFLNDLGQTSATYGLEERDLPQTMRHIFQKFRGGLDGAKREVISLNHMAQRHKQCDDKLSTLLQAFQTAMTMCQCIKLDRQSTARRGIYIGFYHRLLRFFKFRSKANANNDKRDGTVKNIT